MELITQEVNSNFKVKFTMLNSSLCNYNNASIFVKGTITITGVVADAAARQDDKRDKKVIFKNCTLFTNCISEKNNSQIGNIKQTDVAMSMENLIECSDNNSKTSGHL